MLKGSSAEHCTQQVSTNNSKLHDYSLSICKASIPPNLPVNHAKYVLVNEAKQAVTLVSSPEFKWLVFAALNRQVWLSQCVHGGCTACTPPSVVMSPAYITTLTKNAESQLHTGLLCLCVWRSVSRHSVTPCRQKHAVSK